MLCGSEACSPRSAAVPCTVDSTSDNTVHTTVHNTVHNTFHNTVDKLCASCMFVKCYCKAMNVMTYRTAHFEPASKYSTADLS